MALARTAIPTGPGLWNAVIAEWLSPRSVTVSTDTVPKATAGAMEGVDPKTLPVTQRINLLVRALNGAKRTNEALARCGDGEAMLDVLLDASAKLGLGLSRVDLQNTPPIRDWIWWKNKEALLTIGDNTPRYQQDARVPDQGSAPQAPGGNPPVSDSGSPEPARKRFLGLF